MTDVLVRTNIAYGSAPAQQYDVYIPQQESDTPALCIIDNNWWEQDNRSQWTSTALSWAQRGLAVAIISYRPLGRTGNGSNLLRDVHAGIEAAQRECAASGAAHVSNLSLLGIAGGSFLARALARQNDLSDATISALINCDSRYAWETNDEQFQGAHADELDPAFTLDLPQLCLTEDGKTANYAAPECEWASGRAS